MATMSFDFFELSPDVCCILTLEGDVIRSNRATERVLGYSSQYLEKMNVTDLVHPEDKLGFAKSLDGLLNGHAQCSQFENRFRAADGAYRWLRWNATHHDGRILATAHDITESKANLERRYRRLFETAKDAILIADATDGGILDLNHHTAELTGYEQSELRWLQIWASPPFLPHNLGRRIFEALQSSETFRTEADLATKAGGMVPCEL